MTPEELIQLKRIADALEAIGQQNERIIKAIESSGYRGGGRRKGTGYGLFALKPPNDILQRFQPNDTFSVPAIAYQFDPNKNRISFWSPFVMHEGTGAALPPSGPGNLIGSIEVNGTIWKRDSGFKDAAWNLSGERYKLTPLQILTMTVSQDKEKGTAFAFITRRADALNEDPLALSYADYPNEQKDTPK